MIVKQLYFFITNICDSLWHEISKIDIKRQKHDKKNENLFRSVIITIRKVGREYKRNQADIEYEFMNYFESEM